MPLTDEHKRDCDESSALYPSCTLKPSVEDDTEAGFMTWNPMHMARILDTGEWQAGGRPQNPDPDPEHR